MAFAAADLAPEMLQLNGQLPDWVEDETDVLPLTPTQPMEQPTFGPETDAAEAQQESRSARPKRPLAPYSQREIYEKKPLSSRRMPASSGRRSINKATPDSSTPGTGAGLKSHATSTAMSPSASIPAITARRSTATTKATATTTGDESTTARMRAAPDTGMSPRPLSSRQQHVPHHMQPTKSAAARLQLAGVTASELTGAAAAGASTAADKSRAFKAGRTAAAGKAANKIKQQQQRQQSQQSMEAAPKSSRDTHASTPASQPQQHEQDQGQQPDQLTLSSGKSPAKSPAKMAAIFVRPSTTPTVSGGGAPEDAAIPAAAIATNPSDGDAVHAPSAACKSTSGPAAASAPAASITASPRRPQHHPPSPHLPAIRSKGTSATTTPKRSNAAASSKDKAKDNSSSNRHHDGDNDCCVQRDAKTPASSRDAAVTPAKPKSTTVRALSPAVAAAAAPTAAPPASPAAEAESSALAAAISREVEPVVQDEAIAAEKDVTLDVDGDASVASATPSKRGADQQQGPVDPQEEMAAATAWRSMDEGRPVEQGCGCVVM
ncbi:hypothetical protein Agub_g15651 [Astrephomene gubernaculifera]|uniref:Uncharacterized protein n=1 Tax=Astrephomene gubernaculifera TaxID=47775 RepID=A0AAD3HUD0_9CHLO|nr:hypothetical protein Agub_g15651 [Astrephomene gubernaculifera]